LKVDIFISPALLDLLCKNIVSCAYDFFKEHPALGNVELPELRRRLALKHGAEILSHFDDLLTVLRQKNLVKVDSNSVSLPGRERKLEGNIADVAQKAEAAILAGGLAPASPAEVETQLKLPPKQLREIMKYLLDTAKVVEAAPDVVFHQSVYDKAKDEVLKLFAKQSELTTSEIRQHLGMNRKYVVPLVELFDRKGVTVRMGDKRRLKS